MLAILLGVLATATPGAAQISRRNNMFAFATSADPAQSPVKGTDTAWDPVHRVFLLVGAAYNFGGPPGVGPVFGRFVDENGVLVTPLFSVKATADGLGGFPRAIYSPDLNGGTGGFMVTYLEEGANKMNRVMTQAVIYPGVAIGPAQQISDTTNPPFLESGAAIAYSATSKRFLVAWKTNDLVGSFVSARVVDLAGTGVGAPTRITSGFGRDPSVAWNAALDRFGISFGGESPENFGNSGFAVVRPDGVMETRQTFNSIAGLTFITDVDYNAVTGRWVMAWHQSPVGVGPEVRSAEFDGAANLISTGLVTRSFAGYDAMSLAYNPISQSIMIAGITGTDVIVALELNGSGTPVTGLSSLGDGAVARYVRASSSSDRKDWSITANNNFRSGIALIATTGGVTTTPPPPPPPPPSGCTTVQPGPDWVCVNGGWVPPTTTTPPPGGGGSTSGCPTAQPGPDWVCVGGNWLPPGSGGGGTSACPTAQPGAGWVCVNGNWLPPSGGGASTSSCTTPMPGANWVCVNGNWLPPGSGGGSTSSCTTPQPGAGWTCVNGNWLPPTSSCTTPQPGSDWVCVSGNWLPPGSGGGSTSSCTTPMPGAGWTCVNGSWLPPGTTPVGSTSSCTTPMPGAGWTCSNGNWLPPGMGSTSSCTTPQPGVGWTCVSGNWLPPSTVACTTVQPGPNWVCVNGDWRPPSEP